MYIFWVDRPTCLLYFYSLFFIVHILILQNQGTWNVTIDADSVNGQYRERIENTSCSLVRCVLGMWTVLGLRLMTYSENTRTQEQTRTDENESWETSFFSLLESERLGRIYSCWRLRLQWQISDYVDYLHKYFCYCSRWPNPLFWGILLKKIQSFKDLVWLNGIMR